MAIEAWLRLKEEKKNDLKTNIGTRAPDLFSNDYVRTRKKQTSYTRILMDILNRYGDTDSTKKNPF